MDEESWAPRLPAELETGPCEASATRAVRPPQPGSHLRQWSQPWPKISPPALPSKHSPPLSPAYLLFPPDGLWWRGLAPYSSFSPKIWDLILLPSLSDPNFFFLTALLKTCRQQKEEFELFSCWSAEPRQLSRSDSVIEESTRSVRETGPRRERG